MLSNESADPVLTLAPQTPHIVQPNSVTLIHIYRSTEVNGIMEGIEDFGIRPTEPLWLIAKDSAKRENTMIVHPSWEIHTIVFTQNKTNKNINSTALVSPPALFYNRPKGHLVKLRTRELKKH